MPTGTIEGVSDDTRDDAAPRTRDADGTRQRLLAAARRRFAVDGYTTTTVRDIAGDAGVNVALINRYFVSKEGLFEACLTDVAQELDRGDDELTLDRIARRVVEQVVTPVGGEKPLQLLLLLRTSGDARADEIRRSTLRSFAERIAAAVGWTPGNPDGDELLLRAEIAICAGLGVALLRSSGLEPLGSSTGDELRAPIADVFAALLTR